jgi:hypothetical protein
MVIHDRELLADPRRAALKLPLTRERDRRRLLAGEDLGDEALA